MEVSDWLVENTPELEIDLGKTRVKCQAGLQFGSRFVGGLMPGQVVDFLPEEQLAEIRNLGEFAGILALDKWTGNANGRQAVFARKQRERRYRAVFIDYGYCFHAGGMEVRGYSPARGLLSQRCLPGDYRMGVVRAMVDAAGDDAGGDGVGGGQRGSPGVVRRRPE